MTSDFVDKDHLDYPQGEPSLSGDSHAEFRDGAFIIITQAFCPNGHDLVAYPGPEFDGFPGITINVSGHGIEGLVTLSPMHGDERKEGAEIFDPGKKYLLSCPTCGVHLPELAPCDCGAGHLHTVDLTAAGGDENISICDVAGCRRSRVCDGLEILAVFIED